MSEPDRTGDDIGVAMATADRAQFENDDAREVERKDM
jgi:hypothetical protein